MSQISLQMYTLRDYTKTSYDLEKTLEKLRGAGFSTVQYSVPGEADVSDICRIFRKTGIQNDSVFCPALSIKERKKDVLSQCDAFETDYIRTDSVPRGLTSSAAGYEMFAHYLNEVGNEFKKQCKKLLYHFHTFEFIRFGEETGIDILLRESDPELVQILPDTHWIQCGGEPVVKFLKKYRDRYDYVHVKDYAVAAMQEKLEDRPIRFAPVGEGNLDWNEILTFCKEKGVKSYAIEQDECYGRDPFDCVCTSFKFLSERGLA